MIEGFIGVLILFGLLLMYCLLVMISTWSSYPSDEEIKQINQRTRERIDQLCNKKFK